MPALVEGANARPYDVKRTVYALVKAGRLTTVGAGRGTKYVAR